MGARTCFHPAHPDARRLVAVVVLLGLSGCSGPQSALDPAGREAREMADLFWWMAGGALVVWMLVLWLGVSAIRGRVARQTARQAHLYIIGGGAVFPTVVLTGLLVYGLGVMPELLRPPPEGALRITVIGEQWWWRVRYVAPDGSGVELANEIRLPVNHPAAFEFESPDVIHSFWIPALGGKMDMIPGRRTRLVLHPTRTGTFRGACAEYCGASHALMAFAVVVMEPDAFARWLEHQQQDVEEPADARTTRGRDAFLANGCGACHRVRGLDAPGVIGPDLTHVGGRLTLGAATLANDHAGFVRWMAETKTIKPGVLMPHFGMLPAEELDALAAYLDSLQ